MFFQNRNEQQALLKNDERSINLSGNLKGLLSCTAGVLSAGLMFTFVGGIMYLTSDKNTDIHQDDGQTDSLARVGVELFSGGMLFLSVACCMLTVAGCKIRHLKAADNQARTSNPPSYGSHNVI